MTYSSDTLPSRADDFLDNLGGSGIAGGATYDPAAIMPGVRCGRVQSIWRGVGLSTVIA